MNYKLILLLSATCSSLTQAAPPFESAFDPQHYPDSPTPAFHRRNYITPHQQLSSYNYVIAGGGLAGLVLAARLSDDSSKTVLVLEAGPSGDEVAARINSPGSTYYQSLLNAEPYDWLYKTAPQANANSRVMSQPRGKVLGGSAALNGMYMVRPPKDEVNAWHDLIAPADSKAAEPWQWDNFFSSLKQSEKFTPPTADSQQAAGIRYTGSSHGSSGKLQTTFPGYMVPMSSRWLPTLEAAGIPSTDDAYSGNNLGAFFATSAINPTNWTRSYSRSAHIDTLPPRSNLHILSGATVERIVFSNSTSQSGLMASSLEFSTSNGTAKQTVAVSQEVILSGGAYGSPHILQVSGVGPRDVLEAVSVPVQVELPGVGQHFQDHLATGVFYKTSEDTAGSIKASNSEFSTTPEFLSFVNDAVAYINGSRLFEGDDTFASFQKTISDALASSSSTLVPSQYPEVVEGYKAIYSATVDKVLPSNGAIELVFSINSAGQVAVQSALQTAFSQGRLYITSPSIYTPPTIDPQYFSHPADIVILRQGLKLARVVASTSPLKDILGDEVTPGAAIQSDADIETFIRNNAGTEFHPGSTCAMLPKEKGGVVDASLKVYGTSNVRVVDSSVFPVSFSAHMMAPTYALAEKAAEIILSGNSSNTNSTGTSSGSSGGSSSTGNKKGNAGSVKAAGWLVATLLVVGSLL
ncbi:mala s 12 allergen [Crepidotus variabilis]|uniref:pyranose dehydrogenase (acceptor) n=1 Tax=Crepidotus variabilis TaxID=179855 RepID=A0A9P6E8H1_9AGAR|nr:mala s 12 allergen [Crepidotus variabilis]